MPGRQPDDQIALELRRRTRRDDQNIQLPLMDGYEAIRRIKADPKLQSIPIIVVACAGYRAWPHRHSR